MDDSTPTSTPGTWRPEFDPEPQFRQRRPHNAAQSEHAYSQTRPRRRYGPQKCRICLEEVEPTWPDGTDAGSGFMRASPHAPKYVSEDPELGRLMSPCQCKGSQKYVHEGCLNAWRHASPGHSERNLWTCPTCGFQYRTARLSVGRILSHWSTNLVLTVFVILTVTFVLGFVGDRIIDFYLDPWGSVFSAGSPPHVQPKYYYIEEESSLEKAWQIVEESWGFHFVKGFFAFGIIGFVKTIVVSSPFYYLNLGARRRRRGEGHMDINMAVVVIGAATFTWAAWKFVRALTQRALDKVGEIIVDVQNDDDDEEEGEEVNTARPNNIT